MPVPLNRPRGFTAIGLLNPKSGHNVGGVLRAAGCFGAAMVAVSGKRYHRNGADTLAAHRHLPLLQVEDLWSVVPFDCVPVAVDLIPDAVPLFDYQHPESAFYMFGAEDATIGSNFTAKCRDRVYVPMTVGCLNLAATVNIVLYDRAMKQAAKRPYTFWPPSE